MCACKETDVREQRTSAFSLAAKGRVVAEKRATLSSFKSPFPRYLNALYNPDTDLNKNASFIIVCSFVSGKTICLQSSSPAKTVVLSSVYTASIW
jgi:hypothetical protein